MRKIMLIIIAGLIAFSSVLILSENTVNVASMPPVVIKTCPQAGDTKVDPGLGEISVTFSKDMMTDNMWSWVKISDDTFPEITGDVKYMKDKRTCVAPVKLEPGKTYVIWLNSDKMSGFRDLANIPAVPYLLVFQTKGK